MYTQQAPHAFSKLKRGAIVSEYLDSYVNARKRDKGTILDEIMMITGWSRDHVRRQLAQAASGHLSSLTPADDHRPRESKYSEAARHVLEQVWDWSGRQSGKYLAAVMPVLIDALERHGSLVEGRDGYSPEVREELLSVSPASIDRYLRCARRCDFSGRNVSTKRSHAPSAEFLDYAGGLNESEPGFFMVDTVGHPGTRVEDSHVFTVNATCVHTGWVFTYSIAENVPETLVDLLQWSLDEIKGIPFWVSAIELSNESDRVHNDVESWAQDLDIHFTPVYKDHRRDQPPDASRYQHLVHEYGFINRYDTEEARGALNHLWRAVDDRLNFFTPTRKPIAWEEDLTGQRKRLYDEPATPLDRLVEAGVMSPVQEAELITYRNSLDPAQLMADITRWQARLRELAG